MRNTVFKYFSSLLLVILNMLYLSGCMVNTSIISPEMRAQTADHLAKTTGWQEHTIQTNPFTLKSYGPAAREKINILTIYIEGDGLAWLSDDLPSTNPTPMNFTALKMAIKNQKNKSVVYLARPCQLVFNKEWQGCQPLYWTDLRFSPEVINAMNQAINYLKYYYHVKKIILIGYSGGGTIATLIAAKRSDVVKLITVAAVLDLKQWEIQENLTPLNGSLDPADFWENLVSIPQTHWVGSNDTVVPKEVTFAFAKHFPATQKPKIIVLPGFDHICCWAEKWTPS